MTEDDADITMQIGFDDGYVSERVLERIMDVMKYP